MAISSEQTHARAWLNQKARLVDDNDKCAGIPRLLVVLIDVSIFRELRSLY